MSKFKALLLAIPLMVLMVMPVNATNINGAINTNIDCSTEKRHYNVRVFLNDRNHELQFTNETGKPFVTEVSQRTFIPYRIMAESLGATVEWLETTRQVKAGYNSNTVLLTINQQEYYVNGEKRFMEDAAPFIIPEESRTYIPYRYLSEGLGCTVDWIKDDTLNILYVASFNQWQTREEMKRILEDIKATPPVDEPVPTTGITNVNQLTPELIQTIKAKQAIKADENWSIIEDKYHQEYVKAITNDLKAITYEGAQTVVVSKDMYYINTRGSKRYRIIVNSTEIWDVGVGFDGESRFATPGAKIGTITE